MSQLQEDVTKLSIAGGGGAGGAASVQAKLCGRLLQSWPWSSVAAGNCNRVDLQCGSRPINDVVGF